MRELRRREASRIMSIEIHSFFSSIQTMVVAVESLLTGSLTNTMLRVLD